MTLRRPAALEDVSDGGAGGAGAGGERLPDATLEDARANAAGASGVAGSELDLGVPGDVGAVWETLVRFDRGPIAGRSSASSAASPETVDRALRVADRDVLEATRREDPHAGCQLAAPVRCATGVVLGGEARATHVARGSVSGPVISGRIGPAAVWIAKLSRSVQPRWRR